MTRGDLLDFTFSNLNVSVDFGRPTFAAGAAAAATELILLELDLAANFGFSSVAEAFVDCFNMDIFGIFAFTELEAVEDALAFAILTTTVAVPVFANACVLSDCCVLCVLSC